MPDEKEQNLEKIAIFVDGPNFCSFIDFAKLKRVLVRERVLVGITYYDKKTRVKSREKKLKQLERFGYAVKLSDKDVDSIIVSDIEEICDSIDTIILVSGDSDYFECLKKAKKDGKNIEVVSSQYSISPVYNSIAKITRLEDIK